MLKRVHETYDPMVHAAVREASVAKFARRVVHANNRTITEGSVAESERPTWRGTLYRTEVHVKTYDLPGV